MFVLLGWCCGLYAVCVEVDKHFASSHSWNLLTGSLALLVDILMNPTACAKPSMKQSVLVRTRRALRSVRDHYHDRRGCAAVLTYLKAPQYLMDLLNTLILHSKSSSSPLASIPLLGIAVDVVGHLKNVKDQSLKSVPENIKVCVFDSSFRILHVDIWPKMSAGSELLAPQSCKATISHLICTRSSE